MRKIYYLLALLTLVLPITSSDPSTAPNSDVAYLGVHHEAPRPTTIDHNRLDAHQGVEVINVFEHSAAALMGIQAGDVILAINGAPIANGLDLRKEITRNLVGDPVSAVIRRNGEDIELNGNFGGMGPGKFRQDLKLAEDARYRAEQERRLQEQQQALDELRNQMIALKNDIEKDEDPKQLNLIPRHENSYTRQVKLIEANGGWHLIYVIDSTVSPTLGTEINP